MAMGWLKGLVAPAAFGDQQQQQQGQMMPGMQQPGGPPVGGMMPPQGGSPYGVGPSMGQPALGAGPPPGTPPIGAPGGPAPYDPSQLPNAMQWSTGTRTQGGGGGISGGGISGGVAGGAGAVAGAGGAASLEARCAQLQHDVDSLALFARTLLTMLEDSKVVTRAQFDETKNRLDMLDGKLDDR
jgi:hypothetical protein